MLAIALLTVMVIAVTTTLVLLTSKLQQASSAIGDSVASVKLAEESEVDLLVHANATQPIVRVHLKSRLLRKLEDVERYVGTPEERVMLERARAAVLAYLKGAPHEAQRANGTTPAFRVAHESIRSFVDINVAQAEAARQTAQRWDALGDVIGISAGVLMVSVLVGLGLWIRRAIWRPVVDLAAAMDQFSNGDLSVKAPEDGAAELQTIAMRFNTMAETLARQRKQRLTYLAAVTHDLRNPLAALRLATDPIDPDGPLPPEPRLRRTLALVRRQVTRLDRMVADLFEATQIEAGHLSIQPEVIDLRDVVRAVVALLEGTSQSHRLVVELPEHDLLARVDEARIEQALTNLVSNAIKYSPDGGEVRITARAEGSHAVIAVQDPGIGITQEDRARLWEPFQRGRSTGAIPGTGLGLSTSKRIIEAHGGEIVVESKPHVGSTFSLRLPLHLAS